MSTYSALGPVAVAVFGALNVAGLTAMATGGVYDHIPQATSFPCVRFSVASDLSFSGLGTKPGSGQLSEIDLRVHVYSTYEGMKESHAILAKVAELLKDPLTVTGYGSWAVFFDRAVPIDSGDVIAAVRVSELVGFFRLYVEQQA